MTNPTRPAPPRITAIREAANQTLVELRTAASARDVLSILAQHANRLGQPANPAAGGHFPAVTPETSLGSGISGTICESLHDAGWRFTWVEDTFHWCMAASDGSLLTYVNGDLYDGDHRAPNGSRNPDATEPGEHDRRDRSTYTPDLMSSLSLLHDTWEQRTVQRPFDIVGDLEAMPALDGADIRSEAHPLHGLAQAIDALIQAEDTIARAITSVAEAGMRIRSRESDAISGGIDFGG